MPRRQEFVALPSFPGLVQKQVELAPGYVFGKPRGGKVDIFKKGAKQVAAERTATLQCSCQGGEGGCSISIDNHVAICLNGGCKTCGWVTIVNTEAFVGYLGEVFRS